MKNQEILSFLSSLKETKQRKVRKRPELGGRNTNSSNRSMNSLRSNSISHFVAQIAYRNPRLNVDSKNLHSSKDLLVRNVFEWFRLGGMGAGPPLSNIGRSPGLPKHSMDLGFPKSRICILPLRGGLGGVNVSFSSFLCAKEKDRLRARVVVKKFIDYFFLLS